jgi:hypothetical protein
MSSVIAIEKLNVDAITAKPPRQMGKAKLVFLEPRSLIVTPKIAQAWPIRPMGDDAADDKFSLECKVDDTDALKIGLINFDMKVRQLAFANKKLWFGKAADDIATEADLRQMHTMSIKKGNEKADGSRYEDTVKFKITGWRDFVEEVLYKGEGDKKFPVDIKWRTRIVDSQGRGGPDESQTKFYICEATDMTTGKEQMVPHTPCQDPAGNHIKDAQGNTVYEFVGPKHCQPGCKVRVVFQPTMVWLASKFGVTLAAKQVFITPAPPKARLAVEGIEIKDYVDPILAGRAARSAMASNDLRDLEDLPISDEEADAPGAAGAGGLEATVATNATGSKPEKTKRSEGSPKVIKTKKVKVVDEEF